MSLFESDLGRLGPRTSDPRLPWDPWLPVQGMRRTVAPDLAEPRGVACFDLAARGGVIVSFMLSVFFFFTKSAFAFPIKHNIGDCWYSYPFGIDFTSNICYQVGLTPTKTIQHVVSFKGSPGYEIGRE